ncbi:hypothetical protein [Kribbella sp.]|uniref:hypothetical protein n=1 Tax=Kribbella sp. TaxID=1871183 RepID=UPI002D42B829|nr:hypothetical protein [Kribbella sp.]HZX09275.1 hypothetical protein [Kribbella sp.]
MKRLVAVLWIIAVGMTTYTSTRAIAEQSRAAGRSQFHVLVSAGDKLLTWHGAPSWYYPAYWTLVIVTVVLTVLSWRRT